MAGDAVAGGAGSSKKSKKGPREFDWSKASFEHFVLKLMYVGTKYYGLAWQDPESAPGCETVESKLFEALMKTHLIRDRQSCSYSRCGRTDKGVHAAGNYFALQLRVKPRKEGSAEEAEDYDYPSILNGVLPKDIRVLASARAPAGFDARFSCVYRMYQYYFPLGGENLALMREAAQHFVGEHDFRNFCKMDVENVTNYTRRVLSVSVEGKPGDVGEFAVTGVAFLWHQVRCMAAVLLMVGSGLEEPGVVRELLDIQRHPRKPNYDPADESGLILRDCGFAQVPFAPGLPAPPAGGAAACAATASALRGLPSVVEPLRAMSAQARCQAAVQECLLAAALGSSADEGRPRRPHIPLLQRARNPSLEEKVTALEAKRRRKSSEAEAADGK